MRNRKRISVPLLDRTDIHIEVPHVDYEKPSDGNAANHAAEAIQYRPRGGMV